MVTHQVEFTIHQQFSSRELDFTQQEASMCTVCENGGCSNCEPRNTELQFASGKEIEEFYDNYLEAMYVDPSEMELDGDTPTLDK